MAVMYQVPPGGLYVPNPRTVFDIVARSLAIHCFAICAYTQFISLVSWTTHRRWTIVQMIIFMLIPELAILQALFYVSAILFTRYASSVECVHNSYADPSAMNTKHRLRDSYVPKTLDVGKSTVQTAMETDSEKQFENSSKRAFPSRLHLLFVITTSGPLIVTVLAYKQRLAFTYMAADYVGNLGLDHRNAWISIGGIVAASGSIALLFLKRPSTSKVAFSRTPMSHLELESHAPDIILCQASICSMIHHALLAATNHITPLSYLNHFGGGPLFALLCLGLLLYWRRPKWRTVCKVAVRCLTISFMATTTGTQLYSDIKELLDVSESRVLPYNYRWKVKDWSSSRSTAA